MRAVFWTRYGSPEGLELSEIPKPSPRDDEILIRIRSAGVAAGDCELRALRFSLGLRLLIRLVMGISRPRRKILGQELAGEVEAVGSRVARFERGDRVFGTTGFRFGGYAEYVCVPDDRGGSALAKMPASLTFEEAASVPTGGLEALHFLRQAGDLQGRRILINGAGGGIGVFAVQLAKHFGATVTAVDRTEKLEMLRSIGADRVVDYTVDDFTKTGESYDVMFDVVGKSRFSDTLAVVEDGGRYLLGNPGVTARLRGAWAFARGGRKVVAGAARHRSEDLRILADFAAQGVIRPVVDGHFTLEQIRDAHRRVDSGLVLGTVVLTVSERPFAPAVSGTDPVPG